jgi:dihydroxyacetone kinase DhaKLM complex PTS-EIIA-like component DhaM
MLEIEVIAIEGLDAAIIGTTIRNQCEVLAYDYDKAVAILIDEGHTEEDAEDYVAELSSQEFEGAPAFVYFDTTQGQHGTEPGVTIH